MSVKRTAAALAALAAADREHRASVATELRLRKARNSKVLKAYEAGATYQQIADTLKVTSYRVTQVLRRERERLTKTA